MHFQFVRSCIICTNVAESGVTVADVGFMISSGVQRRISTDIRTGATVNALQTLSKAQMTQQQGRTGRTDERDHITMMSYDQFSCSSTVLGPGTPGRERHKPHDLEISSCWPFFREIAIPVSTTSSGATPCQREDVLAF